MAVNLSRRLPRDDNNGIAELGQVWSRDPHASQIIVAVVECLSVTTHPTTARTLYTASIQAVEGVPLESQEGEAAHALWWRARTQRLGATELPFET